MDWKNKLFFGDNLTILRDHIADETVDLVYLDPPFNSNANYNVLFREKSGQQSHAQIMAFEDTWEWSDEAEATYHDTVLKGGKVAEFLQAFRQILGSSDMMAYLTMMSPRLVELHRVLKPTGSIYLHCDPTASHYLKLVMDAVFGVDVYQNEIVWKRTTTHSDSKTWSRVADVILFYTKSNTFTWNTPREPHSDEYLASKYRYDDGDGKVYRLDNMTSPNPRPNMMYVWKGFPYPEKGWRYSLETMTKLDAEGRIWYPTKKDGTFDTTKRPQLKRYLDEMEGGVMGTIWTDIFPINSQAQERLGYPTQKPEVLLERIITASSNEGDVVLDPFCGCGTSISVAERMHRKWIGIDVTHLAITLIRHRLYNHFNVDLSPFEVIGDPKDLASAQALALESEHDGRYQFQVWAAGLVDAFPATGKFKKGADSGIDGVINFIDDYSGQAKRIIVQVKSGHVKVGDIRDLKGVIGRENAAIGCFITLEEPSGPMKTEAISAGYYESAVKLEGGSAEKFPKIQIVTIAELLAGKKLAFPRHNISTFKQAERKSRSQQPGLF